MLIICNKVKLIILNIIIANILCFIYLESALHVSGHLRLLQRHQILWDVSPTIHYTKMAPLNFGYALGIIRAGITILQGLQNVATSFPCSEDNVTCHMI